MSSKLSGASYLPQDEFIARLKQDFPQVFSDGKVDPAKLQANLKNMVDFDERYGLSWKGKSNVFNVIQSTTTSTLHPQRDESVNFDTTDNLFIEGDNLEALKILQRSYYGKIKMIYIDPPYNTGNDFVYNDHFQEDKAEYEEESGKRDETGNLTSQSALQKNSKDGGHYHSNWLNMMYPRLYLARNLLRDDGVIFVSIDDNEVHNLRLIMNEIFGEENFIMNLIWHRRQNADNRNQNFASTDHEYVLVFSKNLNTQLKGEQVDITKYKNSDNDPRGPWASIDLSGLATKGQRPNLHFDIVDPKTGYSFPPNPTRGWSKSKENIDHMIEKGEILFPSTSNGRPRQKKFLKDLISLQTGFSSILRKDLVGFTTNGTQEFSELFEGRYFSFPKPTNLIKKLVTQATKEEDIILDFFAGSGTTGQAVMDLNAEDGGNRKWICVQLDEKTDEDSEASKAGYKTISEIAKERIRRVGKKIGKGDIGFKALKIGETNMKVWDSAITDPKDLDAQLSLMQNPVRDGVDDESLLLELMVKIGVQPTTKYEKKGEYYQVGDSLIICLTSAMTEATWAAILNDKPEKMIVLDSSFAGNDQLKTNLILTAEKEKIEIVVV